MEKLIEAIYSTPIIDNHAHPLLIPSAQSKYPLLAITTEAGGDAMKATTSTLSHIRAVNQLSAVLGCSATWEDVVKAIEVEKTKPDDAWAKRCMEGVETILVDDGLDGKEEVFDYAWHDRVIRSKCKRIVRLEKVAEDIVDQALKQHSASPDEVFSILMREFEKHVKEACSDPEVVGFKSVICYRTGLDIPPPPSLAEVKPPFINFIAKHRVEGKTKFKRIDGLSLNAHLVHVGASIISNCPPGERKPLQFHTGLGDNDITLTTSSPSHLQEFIRRYPLLPIVLLHASYPWTKEAGYLATVYENVYADIGEIFPFLSKEGQVNAIREILELCPSEKVLWSTDGHWFPETYLLAIIQVREALQVVLTEYVNDNVLSIPQAIKIVEDYFFHTSNKLYNLGLPLKLLSSSPKAFAFRTAPTTSSDLEVLIDFLKRHPSTKFLRLQYLDFTALLKMRVIPVKRALTMLQNQHGLSIGITKASMALLQNDTIIAEGSATGEYRLHAAFSSLKAGPTDNFATVQGDFREGDGSPSALCSRSALQRALLEAKLHGLEFMTGFEIEVVFLIRSSHKDEQRFATIPESRGHAWSSARVMRNDKILKMTEEIYDTLANTGIYLEQWHPESSSGQYEFVLPPLPPLAAVDTLLHAREIIGTVASRYSMHATLHPKPFPMMAGTASHVHISISSPNGEQTAIYESFYAGILAHLRAICAFTYSTAASYDRVADGCWAGGRWVTWGSQNRETPLRKVAGSHWEIKCLDGLANVYLAMAAIISAGVEGVVSQETLVWKDCEKDPASLTADERAKLGIEEPLPASLEEALEELEEDDGLGEMLGKELMARYVAVKKAEANFLNGMETEERREWIIERY